MVRRRDDGPHSQFAIASDAYLAFTQQSSDFGGDPMRVSPDRLSRVNAADVKSARNDSDNHALTVVFDLNDHLSLKSITGYRDWESPETLSFGSSAGLRLPLITDFSTFPFGTTLTTIDPYIGGGSKELEQLTQEIQLIGAMQRLSYTLGAYYYDAEYAEDNPQTFLSLGILPVTVPPMAA